MSVQGQITRYSIDEYDRVVTVGEAWPTFATNAGAPELSEEKVLGRSLWEFVSDSETRQLYRALIERVRRSGAPLTIPFRCDSPDCARYMTLIMTAGEDHGIEFAARVDREVPRNAIALLDTALPRSDESVSICSVCKAILVADDEWLPLEAAVRRLELFEREEPPTLSHGLCPDCVRQFGE